MRHFAYLVGYLYSTIRWRLFLWLALIVLASLLEGVTLGLFLPIIAGADSDSPLHRLFTSAFDYLGIEYTLPLALIAMIVLYALRTALVLVQEIYVAKQVAGLMVAIKARTVDQLLRSDYQYFTKRGVAFFNNAVTVEFTRITDAFHFCARAIVAAGFTLAYVLLGLLVNPALAIPFVVFALPAYFLLKIAFRSVQRVSLLNTSNNALLQSHLIQTLNGFKYFKATDSTRGIWRAVSSAIGEQGRLLFAQRRLESLVRNGIDLLTVLLIALLLLYYVDIVGTALVEMLFMLLILRRTLTFAQNTQRSFQRFLDSSGSVRLFERLSDELDEHEEVFKDDSIPPDFDQPIRLEDVSFEYDGSNQVLEGINLVILPRQKVAFVGPSGSGKTTLATLLTGIIRPTSGVISIGGISYSQLDQRKLRNEIGFVSQESVIFNDTFLNNVSLWDENDCRLERVRPAAKAAYASDFIEAFPGGYETILGDGGIKMSGGQRQRVSIARELYKDARVLILDESTSALDTESEQIIQENIDSLKEDTTLILIAHRLSTVRNSDIIFVLDEGKIVEQGTYEYLYGVGGKFAEMVDQQDLTKNSEANDHPSHGVPGREGAGG